MRILLLTHYYPPEIGAPQRRWDALVRRFRQAGHEVMVVTPTPHYPHGRAGVVDADGVLREVPARLRPGSTHRGEYGEIVRRVTFHEYGRRLGGRGLDQVLAADQTVRVAIRDCRRHRPDVVIATVPGLPLLPAGLLVGWVLKVPVVVEMRDAWPDLLLVRGDWDSGGTGERRAGVRAVLGGTISRMLAPAITTWQRRADAVVTTTESFADVLRGRGVRVVRAIRHGTEVAAVPAADDAAVSIDGTPGRPLRVLYAGTVGRAQGVGVAIRAAARCAELGVPVQVRVVGAGADLGQVLTEAERLGVPVESTAPVPKERMGEHYAWADTVLVTLRPWGPFAWTVPSKLYDALATGRHVSAALTGEAAGIVEASGAGDVVAPGDVEALAALWERLYRAPESLDVGGNGRRWVAAHADHEALAADYLEVLAGVVRG